MKNNYAKLQNLRDKLQARVVRRLGQSKTFHKDNGQSIYTVWGTLWTRLEDGKGSKLGDIRILIGFKNIIFNFNKGNDTVYNFTFTDLKKFIKMVKAMDKFSNVELV